MPTLFTKEQYTLLNEQRDSFESWNSVKYCKNLPREWLHKMSLIHMSVFKSPYVDINCPHCLGQALTRLYGPLLDYEREQKELETVVVKELARKGRTPKNWVKE